MAFTGTFEQFTQELAERLKVAREIGVAQQDITRRAADIGDWLARNVEPRSPEQRLLKELWEGSTNQEQQAIASALVKLVQRKAPTVH